MKKNQKSELELAQATLKKKLSELGTCFNRAKSAWSFKNERTYGQMALHFGIKVWDETLASKKIVISDIEIFYKQLILITNGKFYSKKAIEKSYSSGEINISVEENSRKIGIEVDRSEDSQWSNNRDSIYNPRFPDQRAELLVSGCNQVGAAKRLFDNIEQNEITGQLLLVQTGGGKTYVLGSVIKNIIEHKLIARYKNLSPWPIFYVTRSSIVDQTEGVLRDEFGIDTVNTVRVVNIEFLRTQFGSLLVKEKVTIVNGEESYDYVWNRNIHPFLIVWDECQALARAEMSRQARIAEAVNNINKETGHKVFQIFASATPFARVCEAKCFAVSTGIQFELGAGIAQLDNDNWRTFASTIAAPSEPYEYCEAAIERLIDKLEPFVTRIKNIRPKFKTYNSVQKIHFQTKEEVEEYTKAWEKYQEEKRKIEGDEALSASQGRFALLAQFTIFRKTAEKIRRYHLAEFAHKTWQAGQAPAIACAFKGTITAVVTILINDYNWTREDISLIWGGATESLNQKKKIAKKVKENDLFQKIMKEQGIDLEEIGINLESYEEKTDEQIAFEKTYRLHTQKPEDRNEERLRFQRQDSKVLIFTFKAGGVGLSAHHEKFYPKARPRVGIFTPVYSEKELIQAFGRLPRITSVSDTHQLMCFYSGTIEEEVAARVIMKLKCARKVSKGGESWESIITGNKNQIESPIIDAIDDMEQESASLLGEFVEKL